MKEKEIQENMNKSIEATQRNFNTIRTGRANASLLDRISVLSITEQKHQLNHLPQLVLLTHKQYQYNLLIFHVYKRLRNLFLRVI